MRGTPSASVLHLIKNGRDSWLKNEVTLLVAWAIDGNVDDNKNDSTVLSFLLLRARHIYIDLQTLSIEFVAVNTSVA